MYTYKGISLGLNFCPAPFLDTMSTRSQLHSQLLPVIPNISSLFHGIKSVGSSLKLLSSKYT